jgi:hypothetical protein
VLPMVPSEPSQMFVVCSDASLWVDEICAMSSVYDRSLTWIGGGMPGGVIHSPASSR